MERRILKKLKEKEYLSLFYVNCNENGLNNQFVVIEYFFFFYLFNIIYV